jgi:hypothetical protein
MSITKFSDVTWFHPTNTENNKDQNLENLVNFVSVEEQQNKNSKIQQPGELWSKWRNALKRNGLIDEISMSKPSFLLPLEILSESGNHKNVLVQRCHDPRNPNSVFVAKFVSIKFWKKLLNPKMMPLLGTDAKNVEKNLIQESLNNLFLMKQQQQQQSFSENTENYVCKLVALAWGWCSNKNDENDSSSSSEQDEEENTTSAQQNHHLFKNSTPCLIFENLNCNLIQFFRKQISHDIPRELIRNKLIHDVQKVVLEGILQSNNNENSSSVFLSAHLDICPGNIMIRYLENDHEKSTTTKTEEENNEENNVTKKENDMEHFMKSFVFVLIDWDCAVLSKISQEENNSSVVSRLLKQTVSRYGTPPFADERLLDTQEELMSIEQEDQNNIKNDERFVFDADLKKYFLSTKFVKNCDEYSMRVILNEWLPTK